MPSQMQRIQIGKANYSGSALATRNAALRRASLLGAVLIGAKGVGLEASVGHLGRLVDELRPDAERYRAFFDAGLPITFLGEQYHDKAALDAAIDATRGEHDGRA